jgi:hypothetical protein
MPHKKEMVLEVASLLAKGATSSGKTFNNK